jgi:tetratricopeptide (TPR) repeat protein
VLAWGIPSLIHNDNIRKKILFPAAIAVLAVLAFLTWRQCGYWENSIELFSRSLRITKNNYMAYDNRGIAYGQIGLYKNAINDFNKAIDLKPDYYKGYNNRGFAYTKIGEYQRAIEDYSAAIRLKPDYAKAYNNRADIYLNQGNIRLGCSDAQKACELGRCSMLQAAGKGLCF